MVLHEESVHSLIVTALTYDEVDSSALSVRSYAHVSVHTFVCPQKVV